jgi:hypothetical protein
MGRTAGAQDRTGLSGEKETPNSNPESRPSGEDSKLYPASGTNSKLQKTNSSRGESVTDALDIFESWPRLILLRGRGFRLHGPGPV